MKKTALVDADIICYLSAYYSMTKFDDGSEPWIDMSAAKEEVHRVVEEWRQACGAEEVLMVLSPDDRTNYRKIVWPQYKTHRKSGSKPPHLSDVASYIKDSYEWAQVSYLEGDDVMGILHTRDPDSTVIVSTDKDMMTIAGDHYNPNKHFGCGVQSVSQAQADFWLYTQVLTGDTTDGYKGVKRCGPVAAIRSSRRTTAAMSSMVSQSIGVTLQRSTRRLWKPMSDQVRALVSSLRTLPWHGSSLMTTTLVIRSLCCCPLSTTVSTRS